MIAARLGSSSVLVGGVGPVHGAQRGCSEDGEAAHEHGTVVALTDQCTQRHRDDGGERADDGGSANGPWELLPLISHGHGVL